MDRVWLGKGNSAAARVPILLGVLCVCLASSLVAGPGFAEAWKWGEVSASLDSSFTISTALRVQSRDCSQIATVNGGCNEDSSLFVQARLANSDDGNINYGKGQFFSVLGQAVHDVQIDWRDYGTFVRFAYFADALQAQRSNGDRTDLSGEARFRSSLLQSGVVGAHFYFLDAYAYATFDVWDRFIDFRIGNQALNWGESVFTQGGINTVSTLDVTKIRLAGSELREALLPAPIVRVSATLFDQLSLEAYYQFQWRKTLIDPTGAFFSTSDLVSRGAQGQFSNFLDCGDPGTDDASRGSVLCPTVRSDLIRFPYGFPLLRREDADDHGQWGTAVRYYADAIETEFALYYIRFHDKFPTVSFEGSALDLLPASSGGICAGAPSVPTAGCDIGYLVEYRNGIDLAGFSLNTVVADIAFGFEFSYRFNQPTNLNTDPDVQALVLDLLVGGPGYKVSGSSREGRIVAIANALYVFGPGTPVGGTVVRWLHASDMNFVAEIGVTSYPDLSRPRAAYIGPVGVGRPDHTGGGYQLLIQANYERFLGSPFTVTPSVAFRHDVAGRTPEGDAAFNEDRMQIGLSLEVNYLERWKGILSYSNSFNAGQHDPNNDRDFVGLSVSYAL